MNFKFLTSEDNEHSKTFIFTIKGTSFKTSVSFGSTHIRSQYEILHEKRATALEKKKISFKIQRKIRAKTCFSFD
jgi:hypothetical protein